jgi:hypothetical protein
MLTEFNAFVATLFAASSTLSVFWFDPFPVWAVIVIVIDISVLWGIFKRVGVVGRHLCHYGKPPLEVKFFGLYHGHYNA